MSYVPFKIAKELNLDNDISHMLGDLCPRDMCMTRFLRSILYEKIEREWPAIIHERRGKWNRIKVDITPLERA